MSEDGSQTHKFKQTSPLADGSPGAGHYRNYLHRNKSSIFFSAEWFRLGTKRDLRDQIVAATHIPAKALTSLSLEMFTMGERLAWVTNRKARREEDLAYSLLGLFDVCMPLLYGEGKRKAFRRLDDEIRREMQALLYRPPPGFAPLPGESEKAGYLPGVITMVGSDESPKARFEAGPSIVAVEDQKDPKPQAKL